MKFITNITMETCLKHQVLVNSTRPTPRAADGGSLRDLRAFSTPQQFSGLESVFSPAAANANR